MNFLKSLVLSLFILLQVPFYNLALSDPDESENPYLETEEAIDVLLDRLSLLDNVYIRKAVVLKKEVDAANFLDLEILWNHLQRDLADLLTPENVEGYKTALIAKLKTDKTIFVALKKELDSKQGEEKGSIPLRTSLVKLIGTDKHSGIFDDAIKMLQEEGVRLLQKHPREIKPTHNKITVLKTGLIYANLVIRKLDNLEKFLAFLGEERRLQLLYPANLPKSLDPKSVNSLGLFARIGETECQVFVPNAGFIFGGNFIESRCQGVDCSAFVSYCTESKVRLTTMVMEYTWRELVHGAGSFSEKERPVREEFLEKYQMAEALNEYDAVKPSSVTDLLGGDLIVWRWNEGGSRAGHVVLFLAAVEGTTENEFYGIEANRKDDKSVEGILIGGFRLFKENRDLYTLRRKK